MKVPKRSRDKVMKIICDFYYDREENTYITYEYLYHHGLSKVSNAEHVVKILQSMGYIKISKTLTCRMDSIELTDKGHCYFETNSDNRSDFFKKSVLTPMLITIITNGVIVLIKLLLPLILELGAHTP